MTSTLVAIILFIKIAIAILLEGWEDLDKDGSGSPVQINSGVRDRSFLATLVALHFTPVSEPVGHSFELA